MGSLVTQSLWGGSSRNQKDTGRTPFLLSPPEVFKETPRCGAVHSGFTQRRLTPRIGLIRHGPPLGPPSASRRPPAGLPVRLRPPHPRHLHRPPLPQERPPLERRRGRPFSAGRPAQGGPSRVLLFAFTLLESVSLGVVGAMARAGSATCALACQCYYLVFKLFFE